MAFFPDSKSSRRSAESLFSGKVPDFFKGHFVDKCNVTFECFQFHSRQQAEEETFEQYVTILRQLARTCQFNQLTLEEVLQDNFVGGIGDEQMRKHLQQEKLT